MTLFVHAVTFVFGQPIESPIDLAALPTLRCGPAIANQPPRGRAMGGDPRWAELSPLAR